MELVATGRSVKESFNNGTVESKIESMDYNIKDGVDVVGSAVVYPTFVSVSFNINGTSSVEDGIGRLEEFFHKD